MREESSRRMLYFLPDWEDRIDPHFDFEGDFEPRRRQDSYARTVYAHEIFACPPYDGILISLGVFRDKIHIKEDGQHPTIRGFTDIKKYLRLDKSPKRLQVMGDCGAFSYVNEDKPPFTVMEIADLYHNLNFDLGISLDHVIVDTIVIPGNGKPQKVILSDQEKEVRRQLSLENADRFLRYYKRQGYTFTPLGAAQGYSLETYLDSVKALVDMGYRYIALGGLVRYRTERVEEIVSAVMRFIKQSKLRVKVHLLGLLRQDLLHEFKKLGVTSFDSASYLRKAWLRSAMNYLGVDLNWYAAIRVPYSQDPRMQKAAKQKKKNLGYLKRLERQALQGLKKYALGKQSLKKTLDPVLEYDRFLTRLWNDTDMQKLEMAYRRTLESYIWRKCECEFCRSAGIDVVIFRGTNRNKRRGFHNVKVFYDHILAKA